MSKGGTRLFTVKLINHQTISETTASNFNEVLFVIKQWRKAYGEIEILSVTQNNSSVLPDVSVKE